MIWSYFYSDINELVSGSERAGIYRRNAAYPKSPVDVCFSGLGIDNLAVVSINKTGKSILDRLDHVIVIDQNSRALVIIDDRELERAFVGFSISPNFQGFVPDILFPLS